MAGQDQLCASGSTASHRRDQIVSAKVGMRDVDSMISNQVGDGA
jgi:hypothetical protein